MNEEQEHKEQERPRPRVVDKRVSARAGDADAGGDPGASAGAAADPGASAAPGGDAPSLSSDSPRSADAELRNSPGGTSPPSAARSETAAPASSSEADLTEAAGAGSPTGGPAPAAAAGGQEVWTPQQEEEMRQMAQQIAETPSLEWVVNTAVTLANVAGTKLDLGATADAQLAIDALAALVNGLGPRLQQVETPLRQTLAQLQMAYAERVGPPPPAP
ncbi:MAG TPA: hypothetical protein VG929_08685 [Actinomycetota bacterium]|nr:hypothetical protein [Actinomycetota bacterium]